MASWPEIFYGSAEEILKSMSRKLGPEATTSEAIGHVLDFCKRRGLLLHLQENVKPHIRAALLLAALLEHRLVLPVDQA